MLDRRVWTSYRICEQGQNTRINLKLYIKIVDVVSEICRELVCYSFSVGQYTMSLLIIVVGKPITKQTHHEYYNENVTLAHIMLTTLFRSPNLTCQSCKHCSLVETCLLCFVIMVLLTRILNQNK